MKMLAAILRGRDRIGRPLTDEDLDEWARHHDDPRSIEARAIYNSVIQTEMTSEEAHQLWQRANKLVGQRAPADYAEFLLYGYAEGRMHALELGERNERD